MTTNSSAWIHEAIFQQQHHSVRNFSLLPVGGRRGGEKEGKKQ